MRDERAVHERVAVLDVLARVNARVCAGGNLVGAHLALDFPSSVSRIDLDDALARASGRVDAGRAASFRPSPPGLRGRTRSNSSVHRAADPR